jgi:hypothetical protein
MAWAGLTIPCIWAKATEIVDLVTTVPTCVSLRWYSYLERPIRPITRRVESGCWTLNYYEDGTYTKTPTRVHRNEKSERKERKAYVPYILVPDKCRYSEFCLFCKERLTPLVNAPFLKHDAPLLYLTESHGEVIFSMRHGVIQATLDVVGKFDDPMLYFESGGVKEKEKQKLREVRLAEERKALIIDTGID